MPAKMQLVDSHCHINFDPLADDMPGLLARARDNDIAHMLCVCVNLEDLGQVLALAEAHRHIHASVGVHPCTTGGEDPSTERLLSLADHPRVVAIGETGLDYFHHPDRPAWQRERFARHIEAARTCQRPLIIHTRDAAADTMDMLRTLDAASAGGVMHCFAEDWTVARQALDIGFYISFSGIVTFRSAETLKDVARRVPLDRMLVETDAPYLAPVPYRGKTNEPAYVRHTAACIAELRGEPLDTIAAATTENYFRLFSAASPATH